MPRPERRVQTVSGMGGHMEIYHGEMEDYAGGDLWVPKIAGILDVSRWEVQHRILTSEVTHSGSLGAIKRAVVAQDWTFGCSCPWNIPAAPMRTAQNVLCGFLEQILVGCWSADYNVGLRFYLGDPLLHPDPENPPYLRAPLAIAEEFRTICDCTGKDVVRIDFSGSGNSLLEGWRGSTQLFPLVDTARPLYNL